MLVQNQFELEHWLLINLDYESILFDISLWYLRLFDNFFIINNSYSDFVKWFLSLDMFGQKIIMKGL